MNPLLACIGKYDYNCNSVSTKICQPVERCGPNVRGGRYASGRSAVITRSGGIGSLQYETLYLQIGCRSQQLPAVLKNNLQCKLELARIECARNPAEVGGKGNPVGSVEIDAVEEIVGF